MLFPKVPIGELRIGDSLLDTDGRRWTIVRSLGDKRPLKIEVEMIEEGEASYTSLHDPDELVSIDYLPAAFTAGRCKRCEILYVWPRRHRVLVSRAICSECRRPIGQTTPASLSPYGKRARFEVPKERGKAPPKDDGPPALKRLLKF